MQRERRLLQRVVAVAAMLPIVAGLYGVLSGIDGIGTERIVNVSADSHFRYLSGLLTGIGILFLTCVPGIEHKTGLFRFLTLVVVLGGLSRLLGLYLTGVPSIVMLGALAFELVVTPLLCLWQARVAHLAAGEEAERRAHGSLGQGSTTGASASALASTARSPIR